MIALLACLSLCRPDPAVRPRPIPAVTRVVVLASDPVEVAGRPGQFTIRFHPFGTGLRSDATGSARCGPWTCVRDLDGHVAGPGKLGDGWPVRLTTRGAVATEVVVLARDPWGRRKVKS